MSRSTIRPETKAEIAPFTEDEAMELCEALCLLGYPRQLESAAKAILRHATLRRCKAGETVICEGDKACHAYVVRSGWLRVERLRRHRRRTLSEIMPGGIVGEMGLLRHGPRTATVRAGVDSELFVIDAREFDLLLGSSPEFRLRMEGLAGEREMKLS